MTAWFGAHVPRPGRRSTFDLIAGGHSNLTYGVTDAAARWVLRRPPLGHVLATAHDMGREHRIIAALADTDVPVPPAVGLCADDAVNGAPFYVMGFVDGTSCATRRRPTLLTPRPRGAPPASRSSTCWPRSTPSTSTPSASATSVARRATSSASSSAGTGSGSSRRPASCPVIDDVHDRLAAAIPEQGPAAIVHGDYRLDNCIVGDDGDGRRRPRLGAVHARRPAGRRRACCCVYWTDPGDTLTAAPRASPDDASTGFAHQGRAAGPLRRGVGPRPVATSTTTWPSATGSWPASSRACYTRYAGRGDGRDDASGWSRLFTDHVANAGRAAAADARHGRLT